MRRAVCQGGTPPATDRRPSGAATKCRNRTPRPPPRPPLTPAEARQLAGALRPQEPWLGWAGKRELPGFAVAPVAVHVHERISTQAILDAVRRQDVEKSLFADPEQDYREAVQFYR